MSISLMSQVWTLQLERSERDILLVMADHANDEGVCWPSRARVMWKTDLGKSTVKRTMSALRERGIIRVLQNPGGGRGKVPVYKLHLEKGLKKTPFEEFKKGLMDEEERGSKKDERGSPVSPEPSYEPPSSLEPPVVGEDALVDDVTARCLLLLNRTRGFPRDNAENALKLAEYREEFPAADPEGVCRDLRAWAEENPRSRINRLRLRNFFKSAHGRADEEAKTLRGAASRDAPEDRESRASRRREGYEHLFRETRPREEPEDAGAEEPEGEDAGAEERAERLSWVRGHMERWRSEMDEPGYLLQVTKLKRSAERNGVTAEDVELLDAEIRAALPAGRERDEEPAGELVALVPAEQRRGAVPPEVAAILRRRLAELAEEGGVAFERACAELRTSPWVSDAEKEEIIARARDRAREDGARSA